MCFAGWSPERIEDGTTFAAAAFRRERPLANVATDVDRFASSRRAPGEAQLRGAPAGVFFSPEKGGPGLGCTQMARNASMR